MAKASQVTKAILQDILHYDPDTGIFTWKISTARRIHVGDTAGHIRPDGYGVITLKGVRYLSHRLAFLYMTGEFPANTVDHIDGNTGNNSWSNLRDVEHTENCKNQKRAKNNTSGVIGVNWHSRYKKWTAFISIHGVYKFIGSFDDFFEAVAIRKSAENRHGYHVNHGRTS